LQRPFPSEVFSSQESSSKDSLHSRFSSSSSKETPEVLETVSHHPCVLLYCPNIALSSVLQSQLREWRFEVISIDRPVNDHSWEALLSEMNAVNVALVDCSAGNAAISSVQSRLGDWHTIIFGYSQTQCIRQQSQESYNATSSLASDSSSISESNISRNDNNVDSFEYSNETTSENSNTISGAIPNAVSASPSSPIETALKTSEITDFSQNTCGCGNSDDSLTGVSISSFANLSSKSHFLKKPIHRRHLWKTLLRALYGEAPEGQQSNTAALSSGNMAFDDLGTAGDHTNLIEGEIPATEESTVSSPRINNFGCPILIAEDNSVNRFLIRKLLQSLGYSNVTLVENGKLALEAARNKKFRLVLMDIMMPVMSGIEATERMLHELPIEQRPENIVALTADAVEENRLFYLQCGMRAVITKPVHRNELKAIVENYCCPSESN